MKRRRIGRLVEVHRRLVLRCYEADRLAKQQRKGRIAPAPDYQLRVRRVARWLDAIRETLKVLRSERAQRRRRKP